MFESGQRVVVTGAGDGRYLSFERKKHGYWDTHTSVPAGTVVTIEKETSKYVYVDFDEPIGQRRGGRIEVDQASRFLVPEDPNAPKPRPLGTVPEGSIGPDDPRVAWLWEDAARIATREGHCGVYDKITDELGIPGRVRTFSRTKTVNGISVSATIRARSTQEAEEIFAARIKEAFA